MGAFSLIQSNGLSAPPYVLCFISIVLCAFISDRVGVRGPFVAGAGLVAASMYFSMRSILLQASFRVFRAIFILGAILWS